MWDLQSQNHKIFNQVLTIEQMGVITQVEQKKIKITIRKKRGTSEGIPLFVKNLY